MPFGFLRKRPEPKVAPSEPQQPRSRVRGLAFDGLTEEWRLQGRMQVEGRLSDALNRREAIEITDVSWAPADGTSDFTPVPGLRSIDPYDLIVVLAGEGTQPPLSDAERSAHKVHKIGYDVALEAPPFRVIGTVYLYPGSDPGRLMDRSTEMFVPVTEAVTMLGDRVVGDPDVDTVLVNRFYLRGVSQIDKRTGQRPQPLPGAPLGGVSWTDKSR